MPEVLTTWSECSHPRVGLLTKEPWRVHSSPPSWPPSTRALRDAPPRRFMSCGGRGGGEGAIRGRRLGGVGGGGGGVEAEEEEEVLGVSCGRPDAFRPGRRAADMPSRREPILGKKEHSVVGLFSAGRGDVGGRIGASDEEDRDEAMLGGVRGVRGAEEGREGLEAVSSVELNESLLKGVYLVLGTSSIFRSSVSSAPN